MTCGLESNGSIKQIDVIFFGTIETERNIIYINKRYLLDINSKLNDDNDIVTNKINIFF